MSLVRLLNELSSAGVKVSAEGDQLVVRSANGGIPPELKESLRIHKQELLARLRSPSSLSPPAAARSDPKASGKKTSVARVERTSRHPLSPAQERLWILEELHPGGSVYGMASGWSITGSLDPAVLRLAFADVVARHEILRTTFGDEGGNAPYQRIADRASWPLPLVSLERLSTSKRPRVLRELMAMDGRRPFDLRRGPLIRCMLVRLAEREHVLLTHMHHIISDGWSFGVFFEDLSASYRRRKEARERLVPLDIQYVDYVHWQGGALEGAAIKRQLAYWQSRLAGAPPLSVVPPDRPRPRIPTHRGARRELLLPGHTTAALKTLSGRRGATLFMTLLAAFEVLISRLSGQTDLVVGTPAANRALPEFRRLVGLFLNNLALRTDLSGDPSFEELLARVRSSCLEAYENQEVPFETVIEKLSPSRDASRTPFFQIFFNMLNYAAAEMTFAGNKALPLRFESEHAKFDLTLYVLETVDSLFFVLVYATDLFEPETIERLLRQYAFLLEQIARDPSAAIDSYSLLTPDAESVVPDPRAPLEDLELRVPTVLDRLAVMCAEGGSGIAVRCGASELTYGELDERSATLARALRGSGLQKGDVVALAGEVSVSWVVAFCGILRSGGVVMPLDPRHPDERSRRMLEESGARKLVRADGEPRTFGLELSDVTTIASDGREIAPRGTMTEQLPSLDGSDAAYVYFTSGSTGAPKAILGTHAGLGHFVAWEVERFDLGPADRFAQLTAVSFDAMLREIFAPLTSGGCLCLRRERDRDAFGTLGFLERERISVVHTVPTLAEALLATDSGARSAAGYPGPRWVFFSGEPLRASLVRRWRERFPDSRIVNLYGPTETTMTKCFHEVPSTLDGLEEGVQPLGRPMSGTQALVLSSSGVRCGIGEPGEIVIRTPYRTLGYLERGARTGKPFSANPFRADGGGSAPVRPDDQLYYTGDRGRYRSDGVLEFLGRRDDQVKIRGARVEPGEIEARLASHRDVGGAAVVGHRNGAGDTELVAYLVPASGRSLDLSRLRNELRGVLPDYMVPRYLIELASLPRLANGKLDRDALPAPASAPAPSTSGLQSSSYVAPGTALEKTVASIWSEVLGIDRVGLHDSFLELGGHSLLAIRIVARIRAALQVEVVAGALFERPSVAELVELIASSPGGGRAERIAEVLVEVESLSDDDVRRRMEERDLREQRKEVSG